MFPSPDLNGTARHLKEIVVSEYCRPHSRRSLRRKKENEKGQMAAKEGSAPSLRVSKALVLLLHHSAINWLLVYFRAASVFSTVMELHFQLMCVCSFHIVSHIFRAVTGLSPSSERNHHETISGNREHHQPDTAEKR